MQSANPSPHTIYMCMYVYALQPQLTVFCPQRDWGNKIGMIL